MKKLFKALGSIAILAVLLISFAACDAFDIGGNNGGGNSTGIKELTLSGPVYVLKESDDPPSVSFEAYNEGDLNVYAEGMTEKGTIKNGQLSIKLGTPTDLKDIEYFFDDDTTISPSGAKVFALNSLHIEDSDHRQSLSRCNATISITSSTKSSTEEGVIYFYVDKNVTISSKEKTDTDDYDYFNYSYTRTTKAVSLALKAGWNTVYMKEERSIKNESGKTIETRTTTISLANPSNLKWVLFDSGDDGDDGGSEVVPPPPVEISLTGTTWITDEIEKDEETFIYTLEFSTSTWEMYKEIEDEEPELECEGTYEVDGNTVYLFIDDNDDDDDDEPTFEGVIYGDTLYLTYEDDEELEFHKQ